MPNYKKRFSNLLPPASEAEDKKLLESLSAHNFVGTIIIGVVDGEKDVVDGDRCWAMCQQHGIDIPERQIVEVPFASWDEARRFKLKTIQSRRQLSKLQWCEIGTSIHADVAAEGKRRMAEGSPDSSEPHDTYTLVAEEIGVSRDTYQKFRRIHRDSPASLVLIRSGEESINSMYRKLFEKIDGAEKAVPGTSLSESHDPVDCSSMTTLGVENSAPGVVAPSDIDKIIQSAGIHTDVSNECDDMDGEALEISKLDEIDISTLLSASTSSNDTPSVSSERPWIACNSQSEVDELINSGFEAGSVLRVVSTASMGDIVYLVFREQVTIHSLPTIVDSETAFTPDLKSMPSMIH